MKFEPKDFKNLTFNIYPHIGEKNICDNFPILKERLLPFKKNIRKPIDFDLIVCYVILVFDINSPFVEHFDNITKRKVEVAEFIGIPKTERGFDEPYTAIITDKNPHVNMMWIMFCHLLNNSKWADLVSFMVARDLEKNNMVIEEDATKRKAIISNISTLSDQIDSLWKKIFAGNNSDVIQPTIDDEVATALLDELRLKPEDIAQDIADGKEPVADANPYGNWKMDLYTPNDDKVNNL